ncbi:MAG: caspase family protein [Desulfobacterales bacterium]|nr:caspase family protein [Desulfobacterales bacterium]
MIKKQFKFLIKKLFALGGVLLIFLSLCGCGLYALKKNVEVLSAVEKGTPKEKFVNQLSDPLGMATCEPVGVVDDGVIEACPYILNLSDPWANNIFFHKEKFIGSGRKNIFLSQYIKEIRDNLSYNSNRSLILLNRVTPTKKDIIELFTGVTKGMTRTVDIYDNGKFIGKLGHEGAVLWDHKSEEEIKLEITHSGKLVNSANFKVKPNETYILNFGYSSGVLRMEGDDSSKIIVSSTPSGAMVFSGSSYGNLQYTGYKTPLLWPRTALSSRWAQEYYQVRLDGYEDSPTIFKNNSFGNRNVHFDLISVISNSSKSYSKITKTTNQLSKNVKKVVPSVPSYGSDNNQKWAVIIGISKYQQTGKSGLNNLIFADDDAKDFANSLRNLGWSDSHIKLLTNEEATQRNIMIALESWLSKAGPNDQIVLYWAGHGFPDPEDPEKVYFACYDTDISIPATGYRMDKVRNALEERKSKNVILFADTCHAGKLITRGDRGISIIPRIDKMSRDQKIPKGWIFMVGADTDRQAIEHTSWTNGAFTHSLIKGLSGEADGFRSAGAKDGIVTMGELKDYMNISMPDETQRVLGVAKRPVITTSSGDPDIWNLTLQVNQ